MSFTQDSQLEKKSLLEGKMEILMPTGFIKYSQEIIEQKYPQKGIKPKEVWGDETAAKTLALTHTTTPMSNAQIPNLQESMRKQYEANGVDIISMKVDDSSGRNMLRIVFENNTVNGKIHNSMVLLSLEERLLIVSFNAMLKEGEQWKAIVSKISHSLLIR